MCHLGGCAAPAGSLCARATPRCQRHLPKRVCGEDDAPMHPGATAHALLTSASLACLLGLAPAADWHPHSELNGNALTELPSDVFASNAALKFL